MKIEIRCSHLVQNKMYACQNFIIAELNMGQKTFGVLSKSALTSILEFNLRAKALFFR